MYIAVFSNRLGTHGQVNTHAGIYGIEADGHSTESLVLFLAPCPVNLVCDIKIERTVSRD